MTETTDDPAIQPAPSPNAAAPALADAPPAKKAAPRRKVAARQPAAPPIEIVSGPDDQAIAPVRKPRAPRKKPADAAPGLALAEAPAAPMPEAAPRRQEAAAEPMPTVRAEASAAPAPAEDRAPEPPAARDVGPGLEFAAPVAQAAPPAVEPPPVMAPVLAEPANLPPPAEFIAPSPSTPAPDQAPTQDQAPAGRGYPPRFQGQPGQEQGPRQDGQGYPQGQGRPDNFQRQDRPGRFERRDRHNNNRQDRQNRPPQQGGGDRFQGQGQPGGPPTQHPREGQGFRDGQPHPGRGGNNPNFRDGQPGRSFRDGRDGQTYPREGQDGQAQGPGPGGSDPFVSRVAEPQFGEGLVEVSGKGFGFLRESKRNFVQTPADIFITPEVCREFNLRDGQWVKGEVRRSSRGLQMFRLTELNGEGIEKYRSLPSFEDLVPVNPRKRIKLETVPERYTTRVMDLMTPIGKGQRGLIVAPPRTGKTTLLQHMADAVVKNHPEMKIIILLVDERPEEVTEIRRTIPQAEIMASSNDSDLKNHVRIAQLAMERCKRLVEAGQHVFMLLDSITRMARAFNNAMGGGKATQSGGLSVGALEIPRKIFAAARNTEDAGSLTIMATALIETNSRMDDAIFAEFKGTGNMELVLDRKISDQRIYPAVDIFLSGTRREELLLQPWELDKINVIRRGLAGHKPLEAIERLLGFLKKFPTNAQMLTSLPG